MEPTEKSDVCVPAGMEGMAPEAEAKKGGTGPLIGTAVVIGLLVIGGLYFWSTCPVVSDKMMQGDAAMMEDATPANDGVAADLMMQGDSSDIVSIEADFNATNFGDLSVDAQEFDSAAAPEAGSQPAQ